MPYSIRLVAYETAPPMSYIDSPSHNQHVQSYINGTGLHTLGMLCSDAPGQRIYSSESLLFTPQLVITY